MEKNHDILKKALSRLPQYVPGEGIWKPIAQELDELPLKSALKMLPDYQPDEQLWELITREPNVRKPTHYLRYAAAFALLMGMAGVWLLGRNPQNPVVYSQESADQRLQAHAVEITDQHYQMLKAYCETETVVCNNNDFKRLQQEYEKLTSAASKLEQAIGQYNTEPALVRQFTDIEQQKANVLNKMAKLI